MTGRAVKLPREVQTLDEAAAYIQLHGTPQRAVRFLRAADSTLIMLASISGMGVRYDLDEPLYADLPYYSISRFPKCIVFYRPLVDGIEVLRVLHGACDISGLLVADFSSVTDAEDDDR